MRAAANGIISNHLEIEGYTPLMLAIISYRQQIAIIKELIQYNADVNILTT